MKIMPGKHKDPTIAFRPSAWARAIIEQRAAYLFDKEPPAERRNWKAELELEQYRHVLERESGTENEIEKEMLP